jgi:predicted RNA binding protein YcfA (HicA-like mRNA interferase family)
MGKVSTVKEVVKRIQEDGWVCVSQEGDHRHFKHPVKKGKVTIPVNNKELKKGTANSILKQAGLK